jgi:integrase
MSSGEIQTSKTADQNPTVNHSAIAVVGYLGSLQQGSQRTQSSALDTVADMLGFADKAEVRWHLLPPAVLDGIRARLAERYAPATANRILSALRGVMQQCWRHGLIDSDTRDRLKDLPRVAGTRLPSGRDIPLADQTALLRVCARDSSPAGPRDAALVALMLGCGMRRAEVCSLQLSDFDRSDMSLRVVGKGGRERMIWLTNGSADAMNDWLSIRGCDPGPLFTPIHRSGRIRHGQGLTPHALYLMLASRSSSAKIQPIRPHDARRTFVGTALDRGIDISTVANLVGHASVTTTQRYDRRPDQRRREAMSVMSIPYTKRRSPDGGPA